MTWLEAALGGTVRWIALRPRFEISCLSNPERIVKIPRSDSSRAMLEREHAILTKLNGNSAPRVLAADLRVEGRRLWIQSLLPGRPLRPGLKPRHARLVSAWLGELARRTRGPQLTRLRLLAELSAPDDALEPVVSGLVVPGVLAHNDLNPSNLLLDGPGLGAVDWVMAEEEQIPLFDWFCFCVGMREPLDSPVARAGAESILRALDCDCALVAPLLTLFRATRLRNLNRSATSQARPSRP